MFFEIYFVGPFFVSFPKDENNICHFSGVFMDISQTYRITPQCFFWYNQLFLFLSSWFLSLCQENIPLFSVFEEDKLLSCFWGTVSRKKKRSTSSSPSGKFLEIVIKSDDKHSSRRHYTKDLPLRQK